MGMVLHQEGKTAEAKEYLRKALDSNQNFYGREEAEKTLKAIS